jgi:dinuclear metal center YbgI/SA1388 family protein
MKIKDIANSLQAWAPLSLQENYDNSGLIVGDPNQTVKGITVSLDVTEKVIDEAIINGDNLIVAHHPLIFKGLKKITPDHWVNRCVIKAIKNDIAIYAIHTNLDNIRTGVNRKISDKMGLKNVSILQGKSNALMKLTVFVPAENTHSLLTALFKAGAGEIGNYDHCSFKVEGEGTFRGNESSNPTIGSKSTDETVEEQRVEVIFPKHQQRSVLNAMFESHPYEEVAHYLSSLDNPTNTVGSGMIGDLDEPVSKKAFLELLKSRMGLDTLKFTTTKDKKIKKVAVCGGSGSFLLSAARRQSADAFISADFKYHDYFEAEEEILIADIGHYESEVFTKELIHDFIQENFANIAVRLTKVNTNPINYL